MTFDFQNLFSQIFFKEKKNNNPRFVDLGLSILLAWNYLGSGNPIFEKRTPVNTLVRQELAISRVLIAPVFLILRDF